MAVFSILLSTYNGEKYLRTQLNSILTQSFQDFVIVIRDDGSSDLTMDIINEYVSKYPNKIMVLPSDENLGYPDCFWELLDKSPKADFYSFCDQDDYWYEDKLKRAYEMMTDGNISNDVNNSEDMIATRPKIYYHAYDINYDEGPVVDTYYPGNIKDISIEMQFFYTYTMGFTIILNHAMRQLVLAQKPLKRVLPHDVWVLFNAYYYGDVIYDDKPQACYRRHSNSVTSAGKGVVSLINSWIKKEILGDECIKMRNRLNAFYDQCHDVIPKKDQDKFKLFAINKGIVTYFKRLFYPHRLKDTVGGEMATRILFLLNR